MKQAKRILRIGVARLADDSPDTSWLGEYSDKPGPFAIDRAHDENCQTQSELAKVAIDQLEQAIVYLNIERAAIVNTTDDRNGEIWEAIDNAQDLMIAKQEELAECNCGSGGNWDKREYRYFNPGSVEPFHADANWIPAKIENKEEYWHKTMCENAAKDFDRMEALNAGDWSFIGIRACADVTIGETRQSIYSGGLWGIESDSEESYLAEIERDEMADLRTILYELGFSKRAIAAAINETKAA